jgi:hypothetical protein
MATIILALIAITTASISIVFSVKKDSLPKNTGDDFAEWNLIDNDFNGN